MFVSLLHQQQTGQRLRAQSQYTLFESCTGSNSTSPASKKRRKGAATPSPPSEDARAGLLAEALHLLQRSQAVGESGIEALNGEEGVQEMNNTIVGADATIKAWRFMQVSITVMTITVAAGYEGTVAVALAAGVAT